MQQTTTTPISIAHHPRAFTLIELLVVVSIIALLIAILLPTLRQAREAAFAVKCKANMRSITLASFGYQVDYKYIPGAYTTYDRLYQTPEPTTATSATYGWTAGGALMKTGYLPAHIPTGPNTFAAPVFECPSGIEREDSTLNIGTFYNRLQATPDLWPALNGTSTITMSETHSNSSMNPRFQQSYSMNSRFSEIISMGDAYVTNRQNRHIPIREREIQKVAPNALMMWIEFRQDNTSSKPDVSYNLFRATRNERWSYRTPHHESGNFAAFDGHVGSINDQQIQSAQALGNNQAGARNILRFVWDEN